MEIELTCQYVPTDTLVFEKEEGGRFACFYVKSVAEGELVYLDEEQLKQLRDKISQVIEEK